MFCWLLLSATCRALVAGGVITDSRVFAYRLTELAPPTTPPPMAAAAALGAASAHSGPFSLPQASMCVSAEEMAANGDHAGYVSSERRFVFAPSPPESHLFEFVSVPSIFVLFCCVSQFLGD